MAPWLSEAKTKRNQGILKGFFGVLRLGDYQVILGFAMDLRTVAVFYFSVSLWFVSSAVKIVELRHMENRVESDELGIVWPQTPRRQ